MSGFWKPVGMEKREAIVEASWSWVVSPSSEMLKMRPPFAGWSSGEEVGTVEVQIAASQAAEAASRT